RAGGKLIAPLEPRFGRFRLRHPVASPALGLPVGKPIQANWTIIIKKSARRPPIGDKHKTSAEEGVVCLQQRLACDLEPMAPGAGHYVTFVRRENSVKFYTSYSMKKSGISRSF